MTETTARPFAPHPWQRRECFRSITEVCGGNPSPATAINPTCLQRATLDLDAVDRPEVFEFRGIERAHEEL